MKKRVLLGMSGGVDSSVAAIILLKKGYEVVGVTLKLCPNEYSNLNGIKTCCSVNDVFDARKVSYSLGIDHLVMNFTEIFKKKVINKFVDEYLKGKTPNPCVYCNKYIKFEALLQRAKELNFDYIATGHYANIEYSNKAKRYLLKKSKAKKDQSYVLYNLTQEQLSKTLFPLANLEKSEIRKIALDYGLHVADKPDSQEICFVPDNNYSEFIKNFNKKEFVPGKFTDLEGNFLGTHRGIPFYTLGQRRGLGIALGKHMYVAKINPTENTIVLCDEDHRYIKSVIVDKLNFISVSGINEKIRAQVKIRYQSHTVSATLEPMKDFECDENNGSKNSGISGPKSTKEIYEETKKIKIIFDEKQKLTAPGQSAVFYDGDTVIGGGIISEVFLYNQ